MAQGARRYGLDADMIFKWLRGAAYAPGAAQGVADAPLFLSVAIVSPTRSEVARALLPDSAVPD